MISQQPDIEELLQQARAISQPDTAALVPKCCDVWQEVANAFGRVVLSEERPDLIAGAAECLSVDGIDLNQVERITIKFLRHHLQNILSDSGNVRVDARQVLQAWDQAESFSLLIAYLRNGFVGSALLEQALTWLRTILLELIVNDKASEVVSVSEVLAVAFALHGFRSDFVFSESDQETAVVDRLSTHICSDGERFAESDFLKIALVAMYRPLHLHPRASAILSACIARGSIAARFLARVQLQEPMEENSIRDTISTLSPITDDTSAAVRGQYEENPYPKWHRISVHSKASGSDPAMEGGTSLIAGCGTGHQAVVAAMATPNRVITAIDLSLSSLAYGLRKSREYDLVNIKFLHGDLLDLETSGLRFNNISSVGVIHHMKHPDAGLRALRSVMAEGQGLKVAVYTETGRRDVVAGIALRETLGLTTSPKDMRLLRTLVVELPSDHPAKSLMAYPDFYALSDWRDLVFHVQEHRFTIKSFCEMAHGAGLSVQRLDQPPAAIAAFNRAFPDDNVSDDMAKWHSVEMKNPGVFGSMYRFYLAKI